jgi:hypothetical protein
MALTPQGRGSIPFELDQFSQKNDVQIILNPFDVRKVHET